MELTRTNRRRVLQVATLTGLLITLLGCPTGVGSSDSGDPAGGGNGGGDDTTAAADVALTVTQAGAGRITVEWEEPADEDYDHLLLSIDPADAAEAAVEKGTTTYQFAGLTGDTEYTITAKSVDEAGNLSAGTSVTLTLPVDEMEVKMISTAAELAAIDDDLESLNDYYILTADIDLAGVEWEPIGIDDNGDGETDSPFVGVFDGNNHTISNLAYDSSPTSQYAEYVGLFQQLGEYDSSAGVIRNVTLSNVSIVGHYGDVNSDQVGALVAVNYGLVEKCAVTGTVTATSGLGIESGYTGGLVALNFGTIDECEGDVTVTATNGECRYVGGLVGINSGFYPSGPFGVISRSSTSGDVTGYRDVGGLVGLAQYGEITECQASGAVSAYDENVGGLIGSTGTTVDHENIEVSDCHATGTVAVIGTGTGANRNVGGLIGQSDAYTSVVACSAAGDVFGPLNTGGLIGSAAGSVTDSYALGDVTQGETDPLFKTAIGGLIGFVDVPATISRCYATGNVEFENAMYLGGFAGGNAGTIEDSYARGNAILSDGTVFSESTGGFAGAINNTGAVRRCYATGAVVGITETGGLVGANDSGTIQDSFYDSTTSGMSDIGKGTPKITDDMTTVATFTDAATEGLGNAWDFVGDPNDDSGNDDYWAIDGSINDSYPYLIGLE